MGPPKIAFLALAASLLFNCAFAAPAPPEIIVNSATMQCADFMAGDECVRCTIPQGWASLGYGVTQCPAGYTQVAANITCTGLRIERCCSEGHTGGDGNCTDMVVNDIAGQCAFVNNAPSAQQCGLGSGWQAKQAGVRWLCPAGYSWSNVSCGTSGGTGTTQGGGWTCVPALIFPALLALALFISRK